jgi:site-specific recombinase XerD
VLSSEKLTVREFMERWLEHMAVLGRDKRTLERYRELLQLHALPTIGGLQLKALGSVHLSELYAKLQRHGRRDGRPGRLHPRTVGHVHRALHRMLKQAVRWRCIAQNPATDIELPSIPKTEMVTLSREQAAKAAALLEAAERRLARVALGAEVTEDEYLVICHPDGSPYRPDSVSGMFREFVDDQGLPKGVHVHTLRHSAASCLAAAGYPPATSPRNSAARTGSAGASGLRPPGG